MGHSPLFDSVVVKRGEMNRKDGARWVGLLLGVAGAVAGGFFSFGLLRIALQQRAAYKQFETAGVRIEKLGRDTQREYPETRGMDPGDPGWKMLARYPQYWPWVTGRINREPEFPKPPVAHRAADALQASSWVLAEKESDWRAWGIMTPDGENLDPTPPPSPFAYLLVIVMPVAGFVVPWGAVRAIGRVFHSARFAA